MWNFKRILKTGSKGILYIITGFFLSSIFYTLLYSFLPVGLTPLMVLRTMEHRLQQGEVPCKHDWVARTNINKNAALAVICAEDQNFYHHWGFDIESIQESLEEYKSGGRLRGASSISQQTAKNVFLYPSRSWLRKGLEAYFTFLIELIWSKDRILTVYLNSIEFGTGIYGIEAASQHFFGHAAKYLNRSEAALLASVLPNPHRFNAAAPSSYVRGRQEWVLKQMRQHNYSLPREKVVD
jgi:monofunctional biosynthetic peptidoglycan transglycosylase